MNALQYWAAVAQVTGDTVVAQDEYRAVLIPTAVPHRTNGTAWAIGLLVLVVLGFVTFGLAWGLILPYLLVWAVVAATVRRRTPHLSRQHLLFVDDDGRPLTTPAVHQRRLLGLTGGKVPWAA